MLSTTMLIVHVSMPACVINVIYSFYSLLDGPKQVTSTIGPCCDVRSSNLMDFVTKNMNFRELTELYAAGANVTDYSLSNDKLNYNTIVKCIVGLIYVLWTNIKNKSSAIAESLRWSRNVAQLEQ